MKVKSLSDIYTSLGKGKRNVFVVPQIQFQQSQTDYLYLLYQPLLNDKEYSIKSTSIFGHYKFVIHALFHRESILHYHWLEFQDLKSLLGMPWKLLCIFLFKTFGGNLVWTIHNLEPHNQRWLSLHLNIHRWMARLADRIHIHCENVSDVVLKKFNFQKEKICILPHPTYLTILIERNKAIENLHLQFGIELNPKKPTVLIFGNISTYKKIENILDLIEEQSIPIQCIIAGTIKKGEKNLGKRLAIRSKKNSDIYLLPQRIEEDDVSLFFGAADICFFNYSKILTAGSVLLAHSYQKKIIAPDMGCISELKNAENVYLFLSEEEKEKLFKAIISTLSYE